MTNLDSHFPLACRVGQLLVEVDQLRRENELLRTALADKGLLATFEDDRWIGKIIQVTLCEREKGGA